MRVEPLPRRVADLETPYSGSMRKIEPLIEMLRQDDGRDAYLRHAAVQGLVGMPDEAALYEGVRQIPWEEHMAVDGTLSVDPADLAAAGQDYGGIVTTTPRAVLRPGSTRDILLRL